MSSSRASRSAPALALAAALALAGAPSAAAAASAAARPRLLGEFFASSVATIAGTGWPGFADAPANALAAEFNNP